jgi:hypothetical protein
MNGASTAAGKLAKLAKGDPTAVLVRTFVAESHGAVVRPFIPLVEKLDPAAAKQALRDIVNLEHFLANGPLSAWQEKKVLVLLRRLDKQVNTLPPAARGPFLDQLKERWQQLVFMDKHRVAAFTDDVATQIRKREEEAAKAAGAVSKSPTGQVIADDLTGEVLPRIAQRNASGQSDRRLVKLWTHFVNQVGLGSRGLHEACEYATKKASQVLGVLTAQAKGSRQSRQELMGVLVNVRSRLGEAYALTSRVVRDDLEAEVAAAQEIAKQLEPGHKVVVLTQLEHQIKYVDRNEGPDAVVLIIAPDGKTAYVKAAVQVKTAEKSKAIDQTIGDTRREIGGLGRGARDPALSHLEVTLPGETDATVFALTSHPQVERRAYIVNATDSEIPPIDKRTLEGKGFVVTERKLDMTVDQQTHLSIMVMQASVEARQAADLAAEANKAATATSP